MAGTTGDFAPAIDPDSDEAPFAQLKSQIVEAVRGGTLRVGARLPAVRGLAAEIGLAPNTVAKAYRELEAEGVLEAHGRAGTFVRAPGAGSGPLADAAREFAAEVRRLGVEDDEALQAVLDALGR